MTWQKKRGHLRWPRRSLYALLLLMLIGSVIPAGLGATSARAADAPVLADRTPIAGPVSGGTGIFLIGSGFTTATAVTFKAQSGQFGSATVGCPSASCTIDSESQITVISPAFTVSASQGGPGVVDIIVTGTGGSSGTTGSDTFTYAPVVQSVSPNFWDVSTGLPPTVTVSGAGFEWKDAGGTLHPLAAADVCFGRTPTNSCNSPVSISSTDPDHSFTATPPPHQGATVDVTVTVKSVPSTDNGAADDFNYGSGPPAGSPPTISSVSPTCCSQGKTVTINGTGFTGNVSVSFGNPGCGQAATPAKFTIVSPTQLSATAPIHAAATIDVQVTNDAGSTACAAADAYTYSTPTVSDVSPHVGPSNGGTQLTISGALGSNTFGDDPTAGASAFNGQVTMDGTPICGPCPLNGSSQIVVNTPSHAAGTVNIKVVNTAGASPDNHPNDQFSYFAYRPVVTTVSPASGPTTGGRQVTIGGSNFTAATQVTFGTAHITCPSATCKVDNDGQITVTSPAKPPADLNTVDVTVSTGGGTSAVNDAGCPGTPCSQFTYVAPPVISSIAPTAGPTSGGTTVQITGTGFQNADQVVFGGTVVSPCSPATSACSGGFTTNAQGTIVTVRSPAHDPGPAGVTVHTPAGGNSNAATYNYGRESTHQGVATNTDGRLETFALGVDHVLYHNWQGTPSGTFGGWYAFTPSPTLVSDPAVGRNSDGRLETFVVASTGDLYHLWQTSPSGGWSPLFSLGQPTSGPIQGVPAVATNADGRLEVFARGSDGALWHAWQTAPSGGWGSWYSLGSTGGGPLFSGLAAGRNGDGRLEVLGVDGSGGLYHVWQSAPSGGWGAWYKLASASAFGTPSITTNSDGRLEVVYQDLASAAIFHIWQTAPSGGWGPGYSLGGQLSSDPTIARNGDGRLEVFGTNLSGDVVHVWQTSPGGGWSGVASLAQGGVHLAGDPRPATNADGSLEVMALDANSGSMREDRQVSPGGGWTVWFDMGGAFLGYH